MSRKTNSDLVIFMIIEIPIFGWLGLLGIHN